MGGRGAFKNVNIGDFNFVVGGQTYTKIDSINGIDILIKNKNISIAAPQYSHSPNKTYAVLQNNRIKYISVYENHNQVKCLDFGHKHNKIKPHVHFNMDHNNGYALSDSDYKIIEKIGGKYKTW